MRSCKRSYPCRRSRDSAIAALDQPRCACSTAVPRIHARESHHAARTAFRNLSTSSLSRLLSVESDFAEASTCEDAEPVWPAPWFTSVMLLVTLAALDATSATLREISRVAEPCDSTDPANPKTA